MVNYIATQGLNLVCLCAGFWRSFKLLKAGEVDFSILEFWAVLGVVKLLENTLEWLVSWIPFYWTAKTLALLTLCFPESRLPGILFDTLVIPFMRFCHEVLSEEHVEEKLFERLMVLPFLLLDLVIPGLVFNKNADATKKDADGRSERRSRVCDLNDNMEMDVSVRGEDLASDGKFDSDRHKLGAHKHTSGAHSMGTAEDFRSSDMSRMVSPLSRRVLTPQNQKSHRTRGKDEADKEAYGAAASKRGNLDGEIALEKGTNGEKKGSARMSARMSLRRRIRATGSSGAAQAIEKESGSRTPSKILEGSTSRRRRLWRSSFSSSKGDDDVRADSKAEDKAPSQNRSLGNSMRELLTGDKRVRIRDHLFDLSTTSPPPRTTFRSNQGSGSLGRKQIGRQRVSASAGRPEWK